MYNLKESNDIFQDILLPLSMRENERFFYQIIGVPDNETEYFNKLYFLDNSLRSSSPNCYERYDLCVPQTHSQQSIQEIRNAFKFKDITQKDFVFTKAFISSGCVSHLDGQYINYYRDIFVNVCNKWYKESSAHKSVTFDMIVNFGVKMSGWLNSLLSVITYDSNIIPKVIFYGQEKEHEIYFMELLFNFGFDVLYINTKEISNMKTKSKLDSISKKIQYNNICELPKFPVEEKIVSYETNALKAENEVNELYYDGQSVLKPWQLQKCSTRNIPLKTTYEELFNLWNVESNMRPQFKVQNNTVYIPNLCCKINGVTNDIKEFTRKINELDLEKNCLVFENESLFTEINLDRVVKEILQVNIIDMVDSNGDFHVEQLKTKNCYHYGYLGNPVQTRILDAIKSRFYSILEDGTQKDMVFAIAVLLNLDKRILNLLQNFDYGFAIPKIILYHNNEFEYKKQDKIILETLNEIGFDILAITPTRYCDIENVFTEDILNIFSLENSAMNLKSPFKKEKERKTFFERIFD